MVELAHLAHHVFMWVVQEAPSPKSETSSSGQTASLAALIASITGLVTAIGAIILGLRKRDQAASNPMADKAIEYLIKQNKELLKERARAVDEPKDRRRS